MAELVDHSYLTQHAAMFVCVCEEGHQVSRDFAARGEVGPGDGEPSPGGPHESHHERRAPVLAKQCGRSHQRRQVVGLLSECGGDAEYSDAPAAD